MRLTEQARQALALAEEAALEFHHDYVGTEHLLLGILRQGVRVQGLEIEKVAAEIEKLVQRGPADQVAGDALPRTPRTKRALEFAEDEARLWNQRHVDAGHLLLGLLREPDGVAGLVMRGLGIEARAVRESVLRIRVGQFRAVERVVRPVRASTVRKRKMREELLAHLEVIYEEEQERLGDEDAALKQACRRFGKPEVLTRELERALPWRERSAYSMEKRFGWRAPERAWRFVLRVALWLFAVQLATSVGVCAVAAMAGGEWSLWWWMREGLRLLMFMLALLIFMPLDLFVLGVLYFRTRDALWGVFGARKSRMLALWYSLLSAGVTGILVIGFAMFTTDELELWRVPILGLVAVGAAIVSYGLAYFHGPAEIGDTVWACLDLRDPPAELAT